MPFYEYQCKSCGHELEAMQKVSDAPLRKCPDCGKAQLKRLMSAPVFRLKGGGWYETDFKDKDKQRNLERPEEAPKETKDTDSKAKDDKGADSKEVKTVESKTDGPSAKETAPSKEKAADKSPEKPSGSGSRKASASNSAARARTTRKKPIKVKRRR